MKLGSKKEQLSFDSSDFDQWKSALERVLGIGGVEELLSEDEDIEDDIGGGTYCSLLIIATCRLGIFTQLPYDTINRETRIQRCLWPMQEVVWDACVEYVYTNSIIEGANQIYIHQ